MVDCGFMDRIASRKLVLVGGKGGTGKSSITALMGQYLASNKRVLILEMSSRERQSALFGHDPVGHSQVEVAPNIFCMNIDPRHCFEEYVVMRLGMRRLYDKVFNHRVVRSFLDAMPGLAETMLLGRIYHACELEGQYDHILFDAPASGHLLSLLTTPKAILSTGVGGPLVREVQKVQALLSECGKTGLVLTCLPPPLVASETVDFLHRLLAEAPIEIVGLVLNKSITGPSSHPVDFRLAAPSDDGATAEDRLHDSVVHRYLMHQVAMYERTRQELCSTMDELGLDHDLLHVGLEQPAGLDAISSARATAYWHGSTWTDE